MCILACIDVKYNLHEMNYRIEHVLSFCAGYNVTIISLSFLVVPNGFTGSDGSIGSNGLVVLMVPLVPMVPLVLMVLVVLMVPLVHIYTSRATSMKLMSFEKYTSSILMEGPNQ